MNDVERIVSQTTNDDGNAVTENNGWSVYETQDSLNRTDKVITSRAAGAITPFSREYTYAAVNGTNATTELINGVTEKYGSTSLAQYSYTYDDNGCIDSVKEVKENQTTIATYAYDSQNQIISETVYENSTYTQYTYDVGGNITNVTNMYSYCLNNPVMKIDPTGLCDCKYDGSAGDFCRLEHNYVITITHYN